MPLQLIDPAEPIVVKDSELPGVTGGDPDTTYTLRPIAVEDHREISKKNTKPVIEPLSRRTIDQTDYEAVADDTLDFVLTDWSGILIKGQPAACTRENKLKLDGNRRVALTGLAGMNQIARSPEVRAESFRQPT